MEDKIAKYIEKYRNDKSVTPHRMAKNILSFGGLFTEPIAEELWDEHSETIGTDISDLDYYAGRTVMLKSEFIEAITKKKK